jgi:hypothetical protein
MGKIPTILGAVTILFGSTANASVISLSNTNTEYDTGLFANLQGLEWLSFDETLNIPRSDIESGYNNLITDGWRNATRIEAETLITSLWGGLVDQWSSTNYEGANWLLSNFGYTQFSSLEGNATNYARARFVYGNAGECSQVLERICYGTIEAFDNNPGDLTGYINDGNWTFATTYLANTGQAGYFSDYYGLDTDRLDDGNNTVTPPIYNNQPYASLLVRTPSPVPVPAAAWLFGTGLIGLIGFSKRRKAA